MSSAPASAAIEHEVVLAGDALVEDDDPLALELPRHRARLGERPAVAAEDVLDLRAGAVPVVGEALDDHGDPAGCVSLVRRSAS